MTPVSTDGLFSPWVPGMFSLTLFILIVITLIGLLLFMSSWLGEKHPIPKSSALRKRHHSHRLGPAALPGALLPGGHFLSDFRCGRRLHLLLGRGGRRPRLDGLAADDLFHRRPAGGPGLYLAQGRAGLGTGARNGTAPTMKLLSGYHRHRDQLGPREQPLAHVFRAVLLLRGRGHGLHLPLRHRPLRRRGLSRAPPAGGPADRLRHRLQKDRARWCCGSTSRWPSPNG